MVILIITDVIILLRLMHRLLYWLLQMAVTDNFVFLYKIVNLLHAVISVLSVFGGYA